MFSKACRLCSICARGGSKGIKNKNIRKFGNKPLIGHVIEIVKSCDLFDVVAVSSDSNEILHIAEDYGASYLIKRPLEMATDTAAKLPAIQHCAKEVERQVGSTFDTYVDVSVTAPLMLPVDLRGAVELLESSQAINVISASLCSHSPYFSVVEKNGNFFQLVKKGEGPFVRRQDCPPCFALNGAIYAWKASHFFSLSSIMTDKTMIYEMPRERSIDIDSEFDLEFAEFLFSRSKREAQ